ncbi:MAG: hypothetical protein ACT4P5_22280 [Armatimonadota bacterium]
MAHGVDPLLLVIKDRGPLGMEVPQAVVDCCSGADIVIDLQHLNWGYSDSRNAVIRAMGTKAGVYKVLHGLEEDIESFCTIGPDPVIQARTDRIATIIDYATAIHIKSDDGTDLHVSRGPRSQRSLFRPQGQAAFSPPEDGVNGVMMFKGACRVQGPTLIKKLVHGPVRILWENGKIVAISRDTEFGIFLDEWLRSVENTAAYQFAHINFGVDHRVKMHNCDNTPLHYNYGGILVGVGTNYSAVFGTPSVKLRSHVELQWVGQSAWVDGKHVLEKGRYTPESAVHAGE